MAELMSLCLSVLGHLPASDAQSGVLEFGTLSAYGIWHAFCLRNVHSLPQPVKNGEIVSERMEGLGGKECPFEG